RRIASRASWSKAIIFAMWSRLLVNSKLARRVGPREGCVRTLPAVTAGCGLLDDRQNLVLAHQQVLVVAVTELLPGVRAEQHAIARLDLHLATGAVVQQAAFADADDDAASRLVLGAVGQHDSAGGRRFGDFALHDHPIA